VRFHLCAALVARAGRPHNVRRRPVTSPPETHSSAHAPQRNWSRTALQAVLHYGGSAAVLFLLFRFLPGRSVWRALELLPVHLWLIVLAGYLATQCVDVIKWRLIVNVAGAGLSVRQAARCYSAGMFGSLFLPSLIGGDLVRAAMAMRLGRSKVGVLFGSLLDRALDFVAVVLLAVAGAMLVPGALDPSRRRIFLLLGGAAILAVVLAGVIAVLIPIRRLSYRVRRLLVNLRRAGRSLVRRPRVLLGALGLGMVAQLTFVGLTAALAEACGLHLRFRAWLFAWPLAKIVAAVPITQGGIGVREAALAALLAPFGAPAVLTVATGLAWEAIVVTGGLAGGLFSLFVRSREG
jgi:uncharacterized membrane protein YbhN (UPF0104 family)